MGVVAQTSFTAQGRTVDLKVYQAGASASEDLRLTSEPVLYQGTESPQSLFEPLLVSRVEFMIRDVGSTLLDRFQDNPSADFRLEFTEDGNLRFIGPVRPLIEEVPIEGDPEYRLQAFDGLKALENVAYQPAANKETVGRAIEMMLREVTGVTSDVRVRFDWRHEGQPTSSMPTNLRLSMPDWMAGERDPNYLDALKTILSFWQLQLMQHAGQWWALERRRRGAIIDEMLLTSGGFAVYQDIDRRKTISGGQIITKASAQVRRPRRRQRLALSSARSRYAFAAEGLVNMQLDAWDYDVGAGTYSLRDWATAGSPTRTERSGHPDDLGAVLDNSGDQISQRSTASAYSYTGREVKIRAEANASTQVAAVIVHDENTGDKRYLNNDGTWSSSVAYIVTGSSGGYQEITIATDTVPDLTNLATIELKSISLGTFYEFSIQGNADDAEGYSEVLENSTAGVSRGDNIDQEYAVGDGDFRNPVAGVLEFYDAGDSAWKKTRVTGWGPQTGPENIHELRVHRLMFQQKRRLRGLDVWTGPPAAFSMLDTLVYEGVDYVPVYAEEYLFRGIQRLVAYELREDAV